MILKVTSNSDDYTTLFDASGPCTDIPRHHIFLLEMFFPLYRDTWFGTLVCADTPLKGSARARYPQTRPALFLGKSSALASSFAPNAANAANPIALGFPPCSVPRRSRHGRVRGSAVPSQAPGGPSPAPAPADARRNTAPPRQRAGLDPAAAAISRGGGRGGTRRQRCAPAAEPREPPSSGAAATPRSRGREEPHSGPEAAAPAGGPRTFLPLPRPFALGPAPGAVGGGVPGPAPPPSLPRRPGLASGGSAGLSRPSSLALPWAGDASRLSRHFAPSPGRDGRRRAERSPGSLTAPLPAGRQDFGRPAGRAPPRLFPEEGEEQLPPPPSPPSSPFSSSSFSSSSLPAPRAERGVTAARRRARHSHTHNGAETHQQGAGGNRRTPRHAPGFSWWGSARLNLPPVRTDKDLLACGGRYGLEKGNSRMVIAST
ncbi:uncharacterized protein LOC141726811 [Zonotrichia albicollis]|uniref:uncharacterized protein LOC141726811 n=1 Tax=Zonotrichia albicollis TaxID=44394 RepID=UPI003D80C759